MPPDKEMPMAFRPNYSQQRGDRDRAKEQKKKERLERREEEAKKRKAERDDLIQPPASAPDAPRTGAEETE
jgi:hypothetical protein